MTVSVRSGALPYFLLIALPFMICFEAAAQAAPWIGRWGAPQCGADGTEIVLTKSLLDLSTFDTRCRIRGVRKRGELFEFDTTCSGEGPTMRARFSARVDGNTLVFTEQRGFQFDPKQFVRCDANRSRDAAASTPAASPSPAGANLSLPLKRGFFVESGTPCGQASNATLTLVRRNAMGSGRILCEFTKIETISATRYRVVEHCTNISSDRADNSFADVVTYDIPSDNVFISRRPRGTEYRARFCEQSTLPEPWRTNDISELIR